MSDFERHTWRAQDGQRVEPMTMWRGTADVPMRHPSYGPCVITNVVMIAGDEYDDVLTLNNN